MRTAILLASLLATAVPALAQANDWGGISIRCSGVTTPGNVAQSIACGAAFSCTPLPLAGLRGDTVTYFVMSTFNGFYVLAGSVDTGNLGCLSLGIPDLANSLVLPPGTIVSLAVGVCTVPDNGRCNGGASPSTTLFQIPAGIPPGAIAFQAAVTSPLSVGGVGLAFTPAVLLTYN
jgi:hypothetical protein